MTQTTAVVQIGNSDDKLSQGYWSLFLKDVGGLVWASAVQVHFYGHSEPSAQWQNACWVFSATPETLAFLRDGLRLIAGRFGQESIALTVGDTEFVQAAS